MLLFMASAGTISGANKAAAIMANKMHCARHRNRIAPQPAPYRGPIAASTRTRDSPAAWVLRMCDGDGHGHGSVPGNARAHRL